MMCREFIIGVGEKKFDFPMHSDTLFNDSESIWNI